MSSHDPRADATSPYVAMFTPRFAVFAALVLALAACDSTTADEAPSADQPVASADLKAVYSDADRPLLTFSDQATFEATAATLDAAARGNGAPLSIHSRFESLGLDNLFVPGAELALADENGRVVIGETTVTLASDGSSATLEGPQGSETVVPNAKSARELLAEALASPDYEAATGKIDRGSGNDFVNWSSALPTAASNGVLINMYYVVSHNSYKTWTGTERANAQSEILASTRSQSISSAESIKPAAFPGLGVGASVMTVDDGHCVSYAAASSGSSKWIEIKAGGDRGLNKDITSSSHYSYGPPTWPSMPQNLRFNQGAGFAVNEKPC